MSTIQKSDCPVFDDGPEAVGDILDWAGAKVEWSSVIVDGATEKRRHDPRAAHWSLCWKPGFIGFMSLRTGCREDQIKAHCASALFIYLWCQGVDVAVAAHCAEAYVAFFDVT